MSLNRRLLLERVIATVCAAAFGFKAWPAQSVGFTTGPAKGSLLIIGGGGRDSGIQKVAWDLAGGRQAHWVYIPTAVHDDDMARAVAPRFARHSAYPVETLHTRDRGIADSAAFSRPLRDATAVFLEGGREWRLADAYLDTRVHVELAGVLARGGLICGTSAGAAILASYLVRGSPQGDQILMAPGHERGFGFLTHAAIDPHVLARHRQGDLEQVVAVHPDLLGIGLDEDAAVVVQGGSMSVVNAHAVLITNAGPDQTTGYFRLPAHASYDLTRRAIQ